MNLVQRAVDAVDTASSQIKKSTGLKVPYRLKRTVKPNPLEGFALGLVGANLGLLAMTLYQNYAAKPIFEASPEADKNPSGSLDSISAVGKLHKDDESSTAAVGRMVHEKVTGEPPKTDNAAKAMSYAVHWGFGMLMGGLYGALRSGKGSGSSDLGVGLAYGTGLWAIGDELAVPILGLQEGPTKSPKTMHANRLVSHLLYGAGLAIGTQAITHVWKNARSGNASNFWNFDELGLEEND